LVLISARETIGSGDDIWTSADKGYDMENDMLWSVYHTVKKTLQQSFPEIHEVACNKLMNIDGKACNNIPATVNKLALSAHLWNWIKIF
jgi:hypothetical protein